MLLGVLFSLAVPWPLALLVDSALGDKPPPPAIEAVFGTNPMVLVVVAAVAGLLITLLTNILNVWDEYVNTNLSQRMILYFRSELSGTRNGSRRRFTTEATRAYSSRE